jgi:hypothetical protein
MIKKKTIEQEHKVHLALQDLKAKLVPQVHRVFRDHQE